MGGWGGDIPRRSAHEAQRDIFAEALADIERMCWHGKERGEILERIHEARKEATRYESTQPT